VAAMGMFAIRPPDQAVAPRAAADRGDTDQARAAARQ
jgi:hypothetical protein